MSVLLQAQQRIMDMTAMKDFMLYQQWETMYAKKIYNEGQRVRRMRDKLKEANSSD